MAAKKTREAGVIAAALEANALLRELGLPFALVGGLAVAVRAEPRFTRDVDLAVAVASDDDAEKVVLQLVRRGYRTISVIEHTRRHRLATTRLRREDGSVILDLLFASSGIEPEIAEAAEPLAFGGGGPLPVARTGHLIALKLLSESERRLQDRIDLQWLKKVATEEDWTLAQIAVKQIKARGFHRGRALVTRLRRLRAA